MRREPFLWDEEYRALIKRVEAMKPPFELVDPEGHVWWEVPTARRHRRLVRILKANDGGSFR